MTVNKKMHSVLFCGEDRPFPFELRKDEDGKTCGQLFVPSTSQVADKGPFVYAGESEREVLERAKHDILVRFPGQHPEFSW